MSKSVHNADDIRSWLLNEIDVRDATVDYATHGMISTSDLWWLYEEHRIMAPADAWLLAATWEDQLPERTIDETLSNPDWWTWFDPRDLGRHGPGSVVARPVAAHLEHRGPPILPVMHYRFESSGPSGMVLGLAALLHGRRVRYAVPDLCGSGQPSGCSARLI
jgi:hypothetical protein